MSIIVPTPNGLPEALKRLRKILATEQYYTEYKKRRHWEPKSVKKAKQKAEKEKKIKKFKRNQSQSS
ncbi:30S ribosomal protein S21 [Candidatus Nesciobacter abundans]|nr:30S ribosomal protein S21 [Candidatus Nesciobacter abundans]